MLTYKEIKAEIDDGQTVLQIAAKYTGDWRTVHDIEIGELRSLLTNYRLLIQGLHGWSGLLLAAVAAIPDETRKAALNGAIDLLVSQLGNPSGKVIATTAPANGAMMVGLCNVAASIPGFDHDGFKVSLNKLSGGHRYGPSVTTEAIDKIIKQGERREALDGLVAASRRFQDAAEESFRTGDSVEEMRLAANSALEA